MLCKTCGRYHTRSCDDCVDSQCVMNCGPAVVDVRGIFDAADAEFKLEHKSETEEQRVGRRAAVRGLMVRIGLYDIWQFSRNEEKRDG
ncbi:hypothetical protein [Lentilitoribacter sp. EG35]|uniref:hypothetical protein n=1 Tax=Lentilitoribacter sp. EG35 TaxID=3234192 RepID=UPI00346062B2